MDRDARTAVVRQAYTAYAAGDRAPLWALLAPEVTFHVGGDHPLSGDYRGIEAVQRYLDTIERLNGGPGGATLDTVFADKSGDMVLLESTTRHGHAERSIGHVLRFEDDRLVELWDNPADPEAEDRYWRARVPAQQRRRVRAHIGVWRSTAGTRGLTRAIADEDSLAPSEPVDGPDRQPHRR